MSEIISVLKLNKIIALTWSRRSGKTFLTFQIIKELLAKKTLKIEEVVHLDFSWFIEKDINLDEILDTYLTLFPDNTPFFVFDEIQEVKNFPEKLISLLNKWYKIIITWSNAHLLSKELSTILRGKMYEKEVLPLNFKEFLKFNNIPFDDHEFISKTPKYKNLFGEYLKRWWFPEITLTQNEIAKENILKTYLDIMIYKDLIDRYSIKNEYILNYFIKKVLSSISKELNINKIYNELQSQNLKTSKDSLYSFYGYLENIYFISSLSNYRAKIKWVKKNFLIDTSFLNLNNEEDLWKRFENMVYLQLKRKYHGIYFLSKNYEIDFYIPDQDLYIQVVYKLDYENTTRETKNLLNQSWRKQIIYFVKDDKIVLDKNIEYIARNEIFLGK